MEIVRYRVGEVDLARVPYFDIALDSDVVHVTAENATFLGHLALSPLNVVVGNPPTETDALARVIADAAAHDTLIVGSLWPLPGAVYATGDLVVTAAE